jgi:hypothetical protein
MNRKSKKEKKRKKELTFIWNVCSNQMNRYSKGVNIDRKSAITLKIWLTHLGFASILYISMQ